MNVGSLSGGTVRTIVVTASDSRFMPFLSGMLRSLAPVLQRPDVDLACFDLGLNEHDRAALTDAGATIRAPGTHFGLAAERFSPALRSFLARPFLPQYFPGYQIYVWIDSDVWFQDPGDFDDYVAGARASGLAITHESEKGYVFQPRLFAWTAKHFVLGYGVANGAYLLSRTHVNAGLFAMHADAVHWRAWQRCYEAAIARTGALVPHDQFALNQALHGALFGGAGRPDTRLLDPGHNWICDRGVPMWNDDRAAFCRPYPPFEPIGVLHLAGPAKGRAYDVQRTSGGTFSTVILHGASPATPLARPPSLKVAVPQPG